MIGLLLFRFSVIAVWSCGSRCRLASSSNTNQTRFWSGLGAFEQSQDEQVDPHAMQRTQRISLGWIEVIKIHPAGSSTTRCAVHSPLAFALQWQQTKAFGNLTQRCKDPALCGPAAFESI